MANADDNRTFRWESLKGMPTKRVFSTPVEARGSLYVIGGCDQMGTPIDAFEVSTHGTDMNTFHTCPAHAVNFCAPF